MPKMQIENFEKENIITISSAAKELAEELNIFATGGVNTVEWVF